MKEFWRKEKRRGGSRVKQKRRGMKVRSLATARGWLQIPAKKHLTTSNAFLGACKLSRLLSLPVLLITSLLASRNALLSMASSVSPTRCCITRELSPSDPIARRDKIHWFSSLARPETHLPIIFTGTRYIESMTKCFSGQVQFGSNRAFSPYLRSEDSTRSFLDIWQPVTRIEILLDVEDDGEGLW